MQKGYVLITGASSGIGLELSKLFAKECRNVVLVSRNADKLETLARELRESYHVSVEVIIKDLTSVNAVDEVVTQLAEKSIEIDSLVNNAGFGLVGEFSESSWEKEIQMIQVNIVALTHLTKLVVPAMKQRGKGEILNVGSTGSFVPGPLNAVYCATKAYVLSFSEAIAEELKDTGISVTCFCPGTTETGFAKAAGAENSRIFQSGVMRADRVAFTGYRALKKGEPVEIVGWLNKLLIFMTRFSSRKLVRKLSRYMMST